jgi:hypothetical protein
MKILQKLNEKEQAVVDEYLRIFEERHSTSIKYLLERNIELEKQVKKLTEKIIRRNISLD